MYLFRAVDSAGQTVDFYLSETRDREAAKLFLKQALANPDNRPPSVFSRDGLRSYPAAIRKLEEEGDLRHGCRQRTRRYCNNRIESDHQVLIVVPSHLVDQWRRELATKFFVPESAEVQVVAESEILNRPLPNRLSLLVVDEAHRTAPFAFCNSGPEHAIYLRLRSLAHLARSILLISGTPVLHQETGFLAILHLLDPNAYPLTDVDAFKKWVTERQTIADALMDLSDDASIFFAEDALNRLETSFSSDPRLVELCAKVRLQISLGSPETTISQPAVLRSP